MFSINCLEITVPEDLWNNPEFQKNNRSIYKNLLSDKDYEEFNKDNLGLEVFRKRFFFNDFYEKKQHGDLKINPDRLLPNNFFGDNINVQAIVGKNGSGKSSLMDLMFMAINNFAFMFERGEEFQAARKLYWIKDLSVNLYFSLIGDQDKSDAEYKLECTPQTTILQIKAKDEETDEEFFDDIVDAVTEVNGKFELGKDRIQTSRALYGLLQDFFYTIVSNYSLQSFVISNYSSNCILYSQKNDKQNPSYFKCCDNITSTLPEYQYSEGKVAWIESIFHKNDGYTCPIVLNPKRDENGINIERELSLAKYREIALLLWAQRNNKDFINGYQLQRIDFKFNEDYILEKTGKSNIEEVLNDIDEQISRTNDTNIYLPSFANWLISIGNFNLSKDSPKLARIALAYLIYKITSIVKYPSYYEFSEGQTKSIYINKKTTKEQAEANLRELLSEIQKDISHSVTKIKQTITFLQHDWLSDDEKTTDITNWFSNIFEISAYYKNYPLQSDKLDDIINNLPPPFFIYDIYLSKKINNTPNGDPINIKELSSGEQQLIQNISTHIYHIRNLISIIESNKHQTLDKKRPGYRNINLVFDEMEICFHPEYQRRFVNLLIEIINNMGLNDQCSFNIFLITHSPFVLSDIPRSNILYMRTEEDKEKEWPKHTFAQNIGEMMYDSFFMEKTIGDFAEHKLKELIMWKQGKNPSMSIEQAEAILNAIGDPVIRSLIEEVDKEGIIND